MNALLQVAACLAVSVAAGLVLVGCADTGEMHRKQAELEARVARLERDFAALSRDRADRLRAPAGSGATAAPPPAPPPAPPSPPVLDPIAATAGPPRYALHLAS